MSAKKHLQTLQTSFIFGLGFFLTVCALSIGYSAFISSYPATVGTGSGLSSTQWNKMISGLQILDTNLSNFSFSGSSVGIGLPTNIMIPSAVNGTNSVGIWMQLWSDATLGPLLFTIGGTPSATGTNRYVNLSVGDNSAMRWLILNYNGQGAYGNVGIGTTSPTNPLTVYSNGSTSPIVAYTTSTNDVFSVLPYPGITYLTSGVYYKNGTWVQSGGTTSALLAFGGNGGNWYASNNSAASWNVASNVQLWTAAGVLQGASSKSIKENYEALDFDTILAKIDQLPVERWNYKSEGSGIKHIGPYAEDFKAAFGIGESNKSIALIDEAGIALAGTKGLIEKMKIQDVAIVELKKENDVLKSLICLDHPDAEVCQK